MTDTRKKGCAVEKKKMPIISREKLRELVKKYPPPQSWYEEDWDEPHPTDVLPFGELLAARGLELVGVRDNNASCNLFHHEFDVVLRVRAAVWRNTRNDS